MTTLQLHTPRKVRTPAIVAAVITGVLALGLLVSGGALLWTDSEKDARGYLSTERHALGTDSAALVTRLDIDLDGARWLFDAGDLGDVRLSARPASSKPLFVGIARTRDVERYLSRTAHTEVDELDYEPFGLFGDFEATYRDRPGADRARRPGNQRFWVASTTGTGDQKLPWQIRHGDWSVVVMNADGTPGVHAGVAGGAKLPFLDELGWTVFGGGVMLGIVTAGLLMLGLSPRGSGRRAPEHLDHQEGQLQ